MTCRTGNVLLTFQLPLQRTNTIVLLTILPTSRKSTKYNYWCCLFAFSFLLVELAVFHQYIGATGTVITNTGGTVSAAWRKHAKKLKKVIVF
jgi:hypothetical protein